MIALAIDKMKIEPIDRTSYFHKDPEPVLSEDAGSEFRRSVRFTFIPGFLCQS
jgi:hypothetical protein